MSESDALLAELRRLHPLRIDLSLDRIRGLLERLDHPERKLPPVIHVAGTNGKGSTVAYLKAMLEAAGRAVHTYISPHLVHFNERIALGHSDGPGQPIGEAELAQVLRRVATVNAGQPMTFFEVTTAAAFVAFAEHPADALVLEVGLGGRLDATNVVDRPALTVITPLSIDHAEWLGPTIADIAGEKAGILKTGVTGLVAPQPPEALDVIERVAARVGAPLIVAGRDYDAYEQGGRLIVQTEERLLDLPKPALLGRHQIINAGLAVVAATHLGPLSLDEKAIAAGLTQTVWPARMQRLTSGRLVRRLAAGSELWLDGGHNPAGGMALAQTIADLEERSPKPTDLVVGMMGRKDAKGYLAPFKGLVRRVITVPIPGGHEVVATPEDLAESARSVGLAAETASDVEAALDHIMQSAPGPRRVVIAGSLYLAGHVLGLEEGVTPEPN